MQQFDIARDVTPVHARVTRLRSETAERVPVSSASSSPEQPLYPGTVTKTKTSTPLRRLGNSFSVDSPASPMVWPRRNVDKAHFFCLVLTFLCRGDA